MPRSLPAWVGGAWALAGVAMAVIQFALASPYHLAELLAATAITLITTGPLLVVAWGLAVRRSTFAGTLGAVLGIGVTGLGVIANSLALGEPPPVQTMVVGAIGVVLGIGAWLARVQIVRDLHEATPHPTTGDRSG